MDKQRKVRNTGDEGRDNDKIQETEQEMNTIQSNDKCCICGCATYTDSSQAYWYSHKCDKENCTGHICSRCHSREYYYDTIGKVTNWRIGELDRYGETGKGCIGAWIVGKSLGIDDLNVRMNNFNWHIDLSRHINYGYSEVKIATLNIRNQRWEYDIKIGQHFDTIFLICMDGDKPWKCVERVYAIRGKNITGITHISIYRITYSKISIYEKFRIDEKLFNDMYCSADIPNRFSPICLWRGKYNKNTV
jgi:hypothetical protein